MRQQAQRLLGRLPVERIAIFADFGARGEPRQNGHLPDDRLAKGIKGADLQATGIVENSPSTLTVALNGGGSQLFGQLRVAISAVAAGCGLKEGVKDAVAHLVGRLAGKGDGKNRFRLGDLRVGQQVEKALDKELGFTGTGGRLNDERTAAVDDRFAHGGVGGFVNNVGASRAHRTLPPPARAGSRPLLPGKPRADGSSSHRKSTGK